MRKTLRSSLALLSFVGAIGRAGLTKEVGLLRPGCFGTEWYGDVPGAWSTRDGDTGNEDNSSFLNLTNMPCLFLPWQVAWQVILIIITLRQALQFGDTGPYKNFDFF